MITQEVAPLDLGRTMRELVARFRQPFKGFLIPLQPECSDDWSPDYAIVKGYYIEFPLCDCNEYFDEDRLLADFEEMVKEHFDGITVVNSSNQKGMTLPTGTTVLIFYRQSQEIEVYRT